MCPIYYTSRSFSFQDESERIRNMGGVVVHCMGVLRVNGFLSISRAIGKCLRFFFFFCKDLKLNENKKFPSKQETYIK